jgi:hypothetical protein
VLVAPQVVEVAQDVTVSLSRDGGEERTVGQLSRTGPEVADTGLEGERRWS